VDVEHSGFWNGEPSRKTGTKGAKKKKKKQKKNSATTPVRVEGGGSVGVGGKPLPWGGGKINGWVYEEGSNHNPSDMFKGQI